MNPAVFTFAEQADWGSHGAQLLPAHDAVMTKPFEFAARDALSGETAASLYSEMEATLAAVPTGKLNMAIIGDHDVGRLTSVLGGSLTKAKAAAAVPFTQPFPPIIYYGDEIGMLGTKGSCSGDASDIPMRKPFKWNAVASPPMSNYCALNSCACNDPHSHDNDGRSVEEQNGVTGSLLEEYKRLISARKAHVALRCGSYHAVPASSPEVWSFLRHAASQETLLVAINVKGSTRTPALDLSGVTITGGSTTVRDVLTGQYLANLTQANQAAYPLSLPTYGYQILAVNVVPNQPAPQVTDGLHVPSDIGPGSLRATQNNATGMGNNVNELDQLYACVEGQTLRFGITGNLATDGTALALFFDAVAGGQNTLNTASFPTPPANINNISGMILDSGFAPAYILHVNAWSGTIYVDHYALATAGGGTKRYIGNGTVNDLDGFLSGGSNPNGMLVALNNSNTAGVTATDASQAGTATSGFELVLPFADLGIAAAQGTIKVMAMLVRGDGEVGNQFLPGLGGGHANLGYVPLNLNNIPGPQYLSLALDRLPGDWDGDGDVDADDYAQFESCYTGPGSAALGPGCDTFDFDSEQDVDLADFAEFQRFFNP